MGSVATATRRGGVPKWLRERSAKPPCIGSNPIAASNYFSTRNLWRRGGGGFYFQVDQAGWAVFSVAEIAYFAERRVAIVVCVVGANPVAAAAAIKSDGEVAACVEA